MKYDRKTRIDKAKACLILGAYGDALGAPVESLKFEEIVAKYGEGNGRIKGIQQLDEAFGVTGAITANTQLALTVADSLTRAYKAGVDKGIIYSYSAYTLEGYIKWLETQGGHNPNFPDPFHGSQMDELFELFNKQGQRAPSSTCLDSLKQVKGASDTNNQSKDYGAVVRAAPIGLFFGNLATQLDPDDRREIAQISTEAVTDAGITHGHPLTDEMSSFFAIIIAQLLHGESLETAVKQEIPDDELDSQGFYILLRKALELSEQEPSTERLLELGHGWDADEALAMGLYCALQFTKGNLDAEDAIRLAVNHDGDSTSVGSIAGNLIGAASGMASIPEGLDHSDTEVGSLYSLLAKYGEAIITVKEYVGRSSQLPKFYEILRSNDYADNLRGTTLHSFLLLLYDYGESLADKIELNENPNDNVTYFYGLLLLETYFDRVGRLEINQAAIDGGMDREASLPLAHQKLDALRSRIKQITDDDQYDFTKTLENSGQALSNRWQGLIR